MCNRRRRATKQRKLGSVGVQHDGGFYLGSKTMDHVIGVLWLTRLAFESSAHGLNQIGGQHFYAD